MIYGNVNLMSHLLLYSSLCHMYFLFHTEAVGLFIKQYGAELCQAQAQLSTLIRWSCKQNILKKAVKECWEEMFSTDLTIKVVKTSFERKMLWEVLKTLVTNVVSQKYEQLNRSKVTNYKQKLKQAQLRLCKLGPGTVLFFYKSLAPIPTYM